MGKIAVDLDRALAARAATGAPGQMAERLLASGDGWSIADVICTSGPGDRSFEEQHTFVAVGMVVAGSFQYHTTHGRAVMTPGSFLLGNPGQCFECSHEHAAGDRCVAFRYAPDYIDRLATDAEVRHDAHGFRTSRLPPTRHVSALTARASAGVSRMVDVAWEELALDVAIAVMRLASDPSRAPSDAPPRTVARVTESVRAIQRNPGAPFTLHQLAADAGQSPFHYLRTFRQLTGVTPHQFILRTRLREAATRLIAAEAKVIDIALESGFGDVSNFNRAFRTEFGLAPCAYRKQFGDRR